MVLVMMIASASVAGATTTLALAILARLKVVMTQNTVAEATNAIQKAPNTKKLRP
jgi:hypothetical protein